MIKLLILFKFRNVIGLVFNFLFNLLIFVKLWVINVVFVLLL